MMLAPLISWLVIFFVMSIGAVFTSELHRENLGLGKNGCIKRASDTANFAVCKCFSRT